MIGIFQVRAAIDLHIIAYAAVLINESMCNGAAVADANIRNTVLMSIFYFLDGFKIVITHDVLADDRGAVANA